MTTILIVDDDASYRRLCRAVLEPSGYIVSEATDGNQVLQRVAQAPVDLVITDILMPGKDGMETIIALRKKHPAVQIIAMSGGGSINAENCLTMARQLGAAAILYKPFTVEQLQQAVRGVLGGSSA